jgi:uncharacterized protein YutD
MASASGRCAEVGEVMRGPFSDVLELYELKLRAYGSEYVMLSGFFGRFGRVTQASLNSFL